MARVVPVICSRRTGRLWEPRRIAAIFWFNDSGGDERIGKRRGQPEFFDIVGRLRRLSDPGDHSKRLPGLSERVPDARTIGLFREKPTKADTIQLLFDRFDAAFRGSGYGVMAARLSTLT